MRSFKKKSHRALLINNIRGGAFFPLFLLEVQRCILTHRARPIMSQVYRADRPCPIHVFSVSGLNLAGTFVLTCTGSTRSCRHFFIDHCVCLHSPLSANQKVSSRNVTDYKVLVWSARHGGSNLSRGFAICVFHSRNRRSPRRSLPRPFPLPTAVKPLKSKLVAWIWALMK